MNYSEIKDVKTESIERALQPNYPLVVGRKGTGKTAIFRRILEDSQQASIVVLSPSILKGDRSWVISPEGFKTIEQILNNTKKSWRDFWLLQTCLACHLSWDADKIQPDLALSNVLEVSLETELEVIRCLERLLDISSIGLLARDWLTRLDRARSSMVILLFDGLDTGFGNTQFDRERRTKAIEGLLSLINDLGEQLKCLKFKVLLREDIWRKLRFENKSHFFGRSVTLQWNNIVDFLKVPIEQALQSASFQELVQSIDRGRLLSSREYWHEAQVFEIWNLLVGERMRGGKSAFTRNWVWNRIADGSDNRSPRALLQLFVEATAWEKREHPQNPYLKTVIRPRALSQCLEEVSRQALDALIKEEFPELQELIDRLKSIGRSPLNASELRELDDKLNLAREVGLLSVYEGTETEVERYKVPDLYLSGIGMTRKGQA